MDRTDSEQEAITLPPSNQIALIARREADSAILQHMGLCPFSKSDIETRVRSIETRFAMLIGVIIGSGILGGAIGGSIVTALAK